MKRFLIIIFFILVLGLSAIYFFIPTIIHYSGVVYIQGSHEAITRVLQDKKQWVEWWPGQQKKDGYFDYDGFHFSPNTAPVVPISIPINREGRQFLAGITCTRLTQDSAQLFWNLEASTSYSPVTRVTAWLQAKRLKNDFLQILDTLSRYYAVVRNLYGYDIRESTVVDSNFIFTSRETDSYPNTGFIYTLIDKLRDFLKQNNAAADNAPMLNITQTDNSRYLVKVALPVNRKLNSTQDISYKWMPRGGNMLITEVKGDNREIEKAFRQVQLYISDHNRVPPAIPYQSLITDRRAETDSTRWITKIYYPVM